VGVGVAGLPLQFGQLGAEVGAVFARAARQLEHTRGQGDVLAQYSQDGVAIARRGGGNATARVDRQCIEVVSDGRCRHNGGVVRALEEEKQDMAESTVLIAGNRNTSSWTLRAWLALRKSGVSFREHWVDLRAPDAKEQLNQLSPTGLVPVLVHEGDVIWDSLAIAEYASEAFAKGKLWPTDVKRRARARSVAAE